MRKLLSRQLDIECNVSLKRNRRLLTYDNDMLLVFPSIDRLFISAIYLM